MNDHPMNRAEMEIFQRANRNRELVMKEALSIHMMPEDTSLASPAPSLADEGSGAVLYTQAVLVECSCRPLSIAPIVQWHLNYMQLRPCSACT